MREALGWMYELKASPGSGLKRPQRTANLVSRSPAKPADSLWNLELKAE